MKNEVFDLWGATRVDRQARIDFLPLGETVRGVVEEIRRDRRGWWPKDLDLGGHRSAPRSSDLGGHSHCLRS